MRRKSFFKVAFIFLGFLSLGIAQEWRIDLRVKPNPSSYISDWEKDPSIASLSITYTGRERVRVKLYAEVTRQGYGVILTGESKPFEVKGPQTIKVNNTKMIDWNTVKYKGDLAEKVLRSGRLPEGRYRVCVEVKSKKGERLAQKCADFTISEIGAPRLIYPRDNDTLFITNPNFQWSGVRVPMGYEVGYKIRFWEIMPGEPMERALQRKPYFEREVKRQTSFLYPLTAPSLKKGKSYLWQVQALDKAGYPLGKREGRSEIRRVVIGHKIPRLPLPKVLRMGGFELRVKNYTSGSISWDSLSGKAESFFISTIPGHPEVKFELDFENLKAQRINGDTAEVISGEVRQDFSPPVEVLVEGFPVYVDSLHLWPDSAHAGVRVGMVCLYEETGCKPAELGPFDTRISPQIDIYKKFGKKDRGPYRIGDTGILIKSTGRVVVDLSRTQPKSNPKPKLEVEQLKFEFPPELIHICIDTTWIGIAFIKGETVEQPEMDTSNTGYLYGKYEFNNGLLMPSGFSATLELSNPWEFTSLEPMGFQISLSSGSIEIDSCKVKEGVFSGNVTLPKGVNGVHTPSGDPLTASFDSLLVDSLLNLACEVKLQKEMRWGGFGFICNTGKFRLLADPYPFFSVVEGDSFYEPDDPDTLIGLVMSGNNLTVYTEDAIGSLKFIRMEGWLNLEMQGMRGSISASKETPHTVVKLGIPGRESYLADSSFVTQLDSTYMRFWFVGNSSFDSDLGGEFVIPAPSGIKPPFRDMEVTSTASLVGGRVVFSDTLTLEHWGVGITSERGVVSVRIGEIVYTDADIYEKVHFSKPFNIIWGEMLADGNLGEFYFNHNCAYQTFDGFPITLDSAALSKYDPGLVGDKRGALIVRSGIHFNFFGEPDTLITVTDSKYLNHPDFPYYGRIVEIEPDSFRLYRFWGSGLAIMDFPGIEYDSTDQNGFKGTGNVDLQEFFPSSPFFSSIVIDSTSISICITETQPHNLIFPPVSLASVKEIWGCIYIEGDELHRLVVGGILTTGAGTNPLPLPLLPQGGASVEVKIVVTPTISKFVCRGLMYVSAAGGDVEVNGRVLLSYDRSIPCLDGEIYGDFDLAQIVTGGMEAEGQLNWHFGEDYFLLQGRAVIAVFGWSVGGGLEGGIFIGDNAPKSQAWVLSDEDGRFGINMENLPDNLTGVYGYGEVSFEKRFLGGVLEGEIEVYLGLGVLPNLLGNAGVYIHGEILWGVVSASAWADLQLMIGTSAYFQGNVGLRGCVAWVFCASVDLTVGLRSSPEPNFYVEW